MWSWLGNGYLPIWIAIWLFFSFVISYLITAAARKFALSRGILAVPNIRSAHTKTKPKGGGASFVIVQTLSSVILLFVDSENINLYLAFIGGGLLVAVAGIIDDWISLPAIPRLIIHFCSALWAVWLLGGYSHIQIGVATLDVSFAGTPLAVLFIVWLLNLYNFMDGIDAIASVEALMVLLPAGAFLMLSGDSSLALPCFILAFAVAGFLPWNWPPSKIFMGDVGSGYIGYCLGVLIVASESRGSLSSLMWIILLAVFFIDATATLVRRLLSGEEWWRAHRTHAYQLLLNDGLDHKQIVMRVIATNCILVSLALIAYYYPVLMLPVLIVVFLILFIMWLSISSGKKQPS